MAHRRLGILVVAKVRVLDFRGPFEVLSVIRLNVSRPLGNLPSDADCRVHPSSQCRVSPLKGARVLPHGAARNPGETGDGEQGVLAGAMSPGAVIFWSITKNLVERRLFWVH